MANGQRGTRKAQDPERPIIVRDGDTPITGSTTNKRKPGPCGPGLVRQRGGASDTFQRGTAACTSIAYLGGWRQPTAQQHDAHYAIPGPSHTTRRGTCQPCGHRKVQRVTRGDALEIVPEGVIPHAFARKIARRAALSSACHDVPLSASHGMPACAASAPRHATMPGRKAGLSAPARNSSAARWRPESRGTPARARPI